MIVADHDKNKATAAVPSEKQSRPADGRRSLRPAGIVRCAAMTGVRIHAPKAKTPPPVMPEHSGSGVLYLEHRMRRISVLCRPGSDLLSQGLSHSTIGAEEFNGRVRNGIGLRLFAKTTRPAKDRNTKQSRQSHTECVWTLKMRAIKPIERLVPVSYMHYCTSTPGLSTWSSSTVLKGILVLRWVSRLDAFSGYPVRT